MVIANLNSSFALLIELLIAISVSIGSYIFKIEKKPTLKNPGAIILLSGFLISVLLSFIYLYVETTYNALDPISISNSKIIIFVSFILFIFLNWARNYQVSYILFMDIIIYGLSKNCLLIFLHLYLCSKTKIVFFDIINLNTQKFFKSLKILIFTLIYSLIELELFFSLR